MKNIIINTALFLFCISVSYGQSSTTKTIQPFADSFDYCIENNQKATCSYSVKWINVSKNKSESGISYTISVSENEDDNERRCSILFHYGEIIDILLITQEGQDITAKFTDSKFIEELKLRGLISDKNKILAREVGKIEKFNIRSARIVSLSGIEYFHNLEFLNCQSNALKILDLQKNRKLKKLLCNNQFIVIGTRPDSSNPLLGNIIFPDLDSIHPFELEEINCNMTAIKKLDFYKCPNLKKIICAHSQFQELDLSNCKKLEELICYASTIEHINVNNCINLQSINCKSNSLKTLRIANCKNLRILECSRNELEELNTSDCIALENLDCSYNEIKSLDFTNNKNLKKLFCTKQADFGTLFEEGRGGLKSLILPDNTQNTSKAGLQEMDCYNNQIESLDISKNPFLEKLNCDFNKLKELNTKNNTLLKELDCAHNYISTLDFSENKELEILKCGKQGYSGNRIRGVDYATLKSLILPNKTESKSTLKLLSYEETDLKTPIDISTLHVLEELNCSNNNIKKLDLTKNPMLKTLICERNPLKLIDIRNCKNIDRVIYTRTFRSIKYMKNLKIIIPPNYNKENINFEPMDRTFPEDPKDFEYQQKKIKIINAE